MTPALLQHLRDMGIEPPPKPQPQPIAACHAPPQWKPSYPGEECPF